MILVDDSTRVIVQGITGRQGRFHTRAMLDYGTNIVAGVTPGKEGQEVEGVPVFNSIRDFGVEADAAILFVPARFSRNAILEAIVAGLNPIVAVTEHIPVHDSMYCIAKAMEKGVNIIGPNTPGVISVGKSKLGIMPNHIFKEGNVALVSRSGTLTYEIVSQLTARGIGQSTVLGLGGDPVTGMDFLTALKLLNDDKDTSVVVLVGEIGGSSEERAAKYIRESFSKPVVAYVAGRTAPEGKTMGHAGAIISGGKGTYDSKKLAFEAAGVPVARLPKDIVGEVASILKN